ncbi:hypothetical protein [Gimesia fumaroli]|uniref:Chromosome partition protein Smc n=1 Tax=Gimesia fumaroli TaxID=2527976 RepID=A0A518IL51_9PLAN|nr:hypothetical protein [Gimesia fumaroli]QDV53821.1 hypothetical protein Enr17x_59040 [Gimesia fumaroli]
MDQVPEHNQDSGCLPFSNTPVTDSKDLSTANERLLEVPAVLKRSYANLLTIEDEYEGLTAAEAETDVKQCNELLLDQEQQISTLARKLNQEKSKLDRFKGDLEEAEVCLAMAQSFEAAVTGWRETIHNMESLHNEFIKSQQSFSLAEQAWEDLKHAEKQAVAKLKSSATTDAISVPYGSTSAIKQESLLPDEVSIEILGDYLPISILTVGAQLSLKQCQQGTATYAVHCL